MRMIFKLLYNNVHGSPVNQLITLVSSVDTLYTPMHDLHVGCNQIDFALTLLRPNCMIWFGKKQQWYFLDSIFHSVDIWVSIFYLLFKCSMSYELSSTPPLSVSYNISNLTRSCYFHLRRMKVIRRSITLTVFATIAHAFICSHTDYCNLLFVGLPHWKPLWIVNTVR